jgi:hypothetical protein
MSSKVLKNSSTSSISVEFSFKYFLSDFLGVWIAGIQWNVDVDVPIFSTDRIGVFFLWEDSKRTVGGTHDDLEAVGRSD